MNKKIKDITVCPECGKEFDAFHLYGLKVPCPHCGEKLDIFCETGIWLDTPFGMVGLDSVGGLGGFFGKKVKWLASLLRHSNKEKKNEKN